MVFPTVRVDESVSELWKDCKEMHQEENQQANGSTNANGFAQPGTRTTVRRRAFICNCKFLGLLSIRFLKGRGSVRGSLATPPQATQPELWK